MTRLPSELHRLYSPLGPGHPDAGDAGNTDADAAAAGLVGADGQVRALVLALPARWDAVAAVWQGVQADLGLPAPAIAVSGTEGYQLWFSLLQPVPVPQATAFLDALCRRYLGGIAPHRIDKLPRVDAAAPARVLHASPVPAQQGSSGRWSAFVAPDLAPMFADEPWLDLPPNRDGQAGLLARLSSVPPADLQRALDLLTPAAAPAAATPLSADQAAQAGAAGGRRDGAQAGADFGAQAGAQTGAQTGGAGQRWPVGPAGAGETAAAPWLEPRGFLLAVMNDGAVPLGLRIEAAKALLPYGAPVRAAEPGAPAPAAQVPAD